MRGIDAGKVGYVFILFQLHKYCICLMELNRKVLEIIPQRVPARIRPIVSGAQKYSR